MDTAFREPLLLFSHPVEIPPCLEGIESRTRVRYRVERVGTGRDAGHRTTHLLTEGEPPGCVLAVGLAGWLSVTDPPLPVLFASDVRSETGRVLRCSLSIPDGTVGGLGFHLARLVTAHSPVSDYRRAKQLAEELGVVAADRSAYPICRACQSRAVPFGVAKAVTDLTRLRAQSRHRPDLEELLRHLGQRLAPLLDWLDRREQERVEAARRDSA